MKIEKFQSIVETENETSDDAGSETPLCPAAESSVNALGMKTCTVVPKYIRFH